MPVIGLFPASLEPTGYLFCSSLELFVLSLSPIGLIAFGSTSVKFFDCSLSVPLPVLSDS